MLLFPIFQKHCLVIFAPIFHLCYRPVLEEFSLCFSLELKSLSDNHSHPTNIETTLVRGSLVRCCHWQLFYQGRKYSCVERLGSTLWEAMCPGHDFGHSSMLVTSCAALGKSLDLSAFVSSTCPEWQGSWMIFITEHLKTGQETYLLQNKELYRGWVSLSVICPENPHFLVQSHIS